MLVSKQLHRKFRGDLLALGYKFHTGLRTTREGEIQAWVRDIGQGRQIHVQEVRHEDGEIAIFAHTEPHGYGLDHLISAVLDDASFSGGARVIIADLRGRGWDL